MKRQFLLSIVAALAVGSTAFGTIHVFDFPIDGAQAGNASPGIGTGNVTYDDVSGVFSWTRPY